MASHKDEIDNQNLKSQNGWYTWPYNEYLGWAFIRPIGNELS